MNLALPELDQPIRLRLARPMTDEELQRFSTENSPLRVERDANGELIIMSPTWSETGHKNSDVTYQLEHGTRETNAGIVFDSSSGFTLPDGSVRSADAAWIPCPFGMLSEKVAAVLLASVLFCNRTSLGH